MGEFPPPQRLSGIIGAIYDCALDPDRWEETLGEIRTLFRCHNAQLVMFDLEQRRATLKKSVGVEARWLDRQPQYEAEFADWERLPQAMRLPPDEPQVLSRHLPPEILANSRYMAEWCFPQGLIDSMALVLMHSPTRHAQIGMGRHASCGLISDREIELGRLLVPHVRRAVMISDILDIKALEAEAAKDVFDTLQAGVVLTDREARILHVNAAADAMLRAGKPIRSAGGMIQTNIQAATAELHAAIDLAARNATEIGKAGLAVRLTEPGHAPVLGSVLPVNTGAIRQRLEPRAVAAVFINSVSKDANGAEAMAVAFNLTRMETRVLTALLAGRTLAESATTLGVAHTTAKTHLGNIFAKTGVSRQVELVRLGSQFTEPVSARSFSRCAGAGTSR